MDTLVRENRNENRTNGQHTTEQFIAPVATVLENGDGYTLEVEMPGVNKEGLEMWVENNELTITGPAFACRRWRARFCTASRVGKISGAPSNSIPSIDTGKISAKIEQGVVSLNLPKAEQVKPRKIAVS